MLVWVALALAGLAFLLSAGLWAVIATMRWWLPRVAPLLLQRQSQTRISFEQPARSRGENVQY